MSLLLNRTTRALRSSLQVVLGNWGRPQAKLQHDQDGTLVNILRQRQKSGGWEQAGQTRVGPNRVHAWIGRADGAIEDLGVSKNLLTNVGRDFWARSWGFPPAGGQGAPATAVTATSLTATGTPWTATNLTTPQLGLAGMRVVAPVTGLTTAPVYGNIVSNTAGVLTLDKWWQGNDTTGTTPAGTNSFLIVPGGIGALRFVALSNDATAPAATDTTLASELTTNNTGRALATFAHTEDGAHNTLTLTYTWTAGGTVTGIHKAGLFSCLPATPGGPLLYESALNADATLASGDTLTLTWSVQLSG